MLATFFGKVTASGFPPQWTDEVVVSVAGAVDLDLTQRLPAPGARLTVLTMFSNTTIRVPAGRRLSVGGLSVAGERRVDVTPAAGPDLTIEVFAVVGAVHITEAPAPTGGTAV